MAYENKPKIIRDKDKDRSVEERTSLDRQRATRESRAEKKRVKDLRKEALGQARNQSTISTKDIRKIKAADEEQLLTMLGRSSSGGKDKGGIYDISTNNYSQPQRNQLGQNSSIEDAGIDTLGGGGADGGSSVEFNGSVLICINGLPFYIDIPYDPTAGVYPFDDGANFPITVPDE
jgi:hypothetical protein